MPEGMSGSGDYVHFKAHVPLHHIPVLTYPIDRPCSVLLALYRCCSVSLLCAYLLTAVYHPLWSIGS